MKMRLHLCFQFGWARIVRIQLAYKLPWRLCTVSFVTPNNNITVYSNDTYKCWKPRKPTTMVKLMKSYNQRVKCNFVPCFCFSFRYVMAFVSYSVLNFYCLQSTSFQRMFRRLWSGFLPCYLLLLLLLLP